MFKKVLMLMAIVLAFAASNLQAGQISCSWVGCDGCLWGDPSNWDCNMVPDNNATNTFAVTIATVQRTRVELDQNRTIDQLDCYGDVDLEIGEANLSLVNPNGLTNYGILDVSGTGVEHEIKGRVTNTKDAHLWITSKVEFHGQFINSGEIMATPDSHLLVDNASLVNTGKFLIYSGFVMTDDVFENTKEGIVEGWGMVYGSQSLSNEGTIYASGGSLAIASEGALLNSGVLGNKPLASLYIKPAEDVNNQGTIEANAGGGVTFDCNLVNEPNGVIELLGGTLAAKTITQQAGATFEGQGDISTANLLIETEGLIRLTGPTNIFGNVQIDPNATLEISDGTTLVKGETICNGTIHMKGGWLIPQGGISGDCNVTPELGLYTNVADFNLDGKVDFKDFSYFANTWLWQADWY